MVLADRPFRVLIAALVALAALAAVAAIAPAAHAARLQARADGAAPRLSVLAPRPQASVSGVVRARTRVRDNRLVRRVVFRVNGRRAAVRRHAPFAFRLDTRRLRNGRNSLRATAYDAAGNHRSRVVRFVVRNVQPAAPRPQASAAINVGSSGGVGTFTPVAITGRTFYVSPSGSDSNDGTSPDRAWKTVRQVNWHGELQPGDGVLFEGGATFADDTLMPEQGGAAGRPIVFGSYGQGRARLGKGVWFRNKSDYAFQNLALPGPGARYGIQGHGDRVTVQGCVFTDDDVAVYADGAGWTIEANSIDHSGDSGMILLGRGHTVRANLIINTGLDPAISYGKHGIYLKSADSHVFENTIRNFESNGVSVRFHDARVESNTISGGPIGIAWFQNDSVGGTSVWRNNDISGTTTVGMYVSRSDEAGPTRESFVVTGNRIAPARGGHLDLPTLPGVAYTLSGNVEV